MGRLPDTTTAPAGTTTLPSALRSTNSPVVESNIGVDEVMITPEAITAFSCTMVPS